MIGNGEENGIRSGGMSILSESVERLDLSVRASNCMKNYNIVLVRDLVRKTREELSRQPNVGKKTIQIIENALAELGLRLGMSDMDIMALQNQGQHLNVFIDTIVAIKNNGISNVDELIQLAADDLMNAPYNLDKEQLAVIEDGLTRWGLRLNTIIPDPFSSQIICHKDVGNFREEVLCVVEQILSARPASWRNCFISYHGLDGCPALTYEEIGNRATDFGFDGIVTRERVRQVINKAGDQITKRVDDVNFALWDRCIRLFEEVQPVSIELFLSICGYDVALNLRRAYGRFRDILMLFRVDFPFDLIEWGGSLFVIEADDLVMKGALAGVRSLSSDLYHSVASLSREIPCDESLLAKIIDTHPRWEFLDDERDYIWKKPRLPPVDYVATGNSILSSLCKVFSVASRAKSLDLTESISRDRGVRRRIPVRVLEGIAEGSGLFGVLRGTISRGDDKQQFIFDEKDRALARICLDKGQTVRSDVLISSLVRSGLSKQEAALTISRNPLLIHVQSGSGGREGIYRFVFSPEDVDSVEPMPSAENDGDGAEERENESSRLCLRIEISSRVLRSGNYSMGEKEIPDGEWRVIGVEGAEICGVAIRGRLVKGLKKVVEAMGLKKGDVVNLRRSEEEGVVIVTKEMAKISAHDNR